MEAPCAGRYRKYQHQHTRSCLPHLLSSAGVAAACGFEFYSLTTGRVPSITIFCARHRPAAWAVLVGLAVHFWQSPVILPVVSDASPL